MAELTPQQRLENLLIVSTDVGLMLWGNLQDSKLAGVVSLSDEAAEVNFRALSQIFDDFVRLRGSTQQIKDSITRPAEISP